MGIRLYVDDLRPAPDDSWTVVRTVTEAIRMLATTDVSEISLDHDIHHWRRFESATGIVIADKEACPETFEAVAWYLAVMPNRPMVKIHTANPAGRVKMEKILEKVGP